MGVIVVGAFILHLYTVARPLVCVDCEGEEGGRGIATDSKALLMVWHKLERRCSSTLQEQQTHITGTVTLDAVGIVDTAGTLM